jgi:seryl-tRNA synthetase
MIDIRILREQPERVREAMRRKGIDVDLDAVLACDAERREVLKEVESQRASQKSANQEMARLPKGSPEFIAKVQEMKAISSRVKELEQSERELEQRWQDWLLQIPNFPHDSVPVAPDPSGNQAIAHWGDVAGVSAHALPHYEIPGFELGLDFTRGSRTTGAGFPYYLGSIARLVRSLISFFLREAHKRGYVEMHVPLLVNAASATATGQLPDKEGQMYSVPTEEFYLIPTAEVPVTNFFRDEIIGEEHLPLYRVAYSACFRREAGSYGKDVRGLNRLHQFDKVELVKWVHPDRSYDELESLRADAESLLQKLGLPYRVLLMCSGDLGFAQAKKYDLEVWAGGQKRWLEVSSCSNFEAFQARRAGIRFRNQKTGKPEPLHTLNGSGLAVPRVLAALLENNLQEDQTIIVPEVLRHDFGADRFRLGDP